MEGSGTERAESAQKKLATPSYTSTFFGDKSLERFVIQLLPATVN
jgi:hypothetical protein